MGKGRGWLSKIDLLPEECRGIVNWAAKELANLDRTQVDVYAEFKQKLIALQHEQGLDFEIPSFRGFSRYSVRLADISKSIEQARNIAATLADRFDSTGSDDLTIIAAEAIKSLMLDAVMMSANGKLTPNSFKELATALNQLSAAQQKSSNRRLKIEAEERARQVEAEMRDKAEKALDILSSEPGISREAIARARREFLGVRKKPEGPAA
ncbi:Protein of unknown function [Rhizobium sp. RU35A]|uniref:phage protein Gp27 family protein n=1 Tax=Rhizobium sp. RU35A TaxID=1907414 RepID=UPI0009574D84|nr:phage protein Gp27 family protein [Rhizobium sp. RU35A]SIQ24133.1 Protein of unknown function [Rhizobium sp. RU35A]